MTEAAQLVVSRPAGRWRDAIRGYEVVVDGALVGKVRAGETLTVPVAPGPHRIQARIDWSGSPASTFEAAPGDAVRFQVEPNGNVFNIVWQIFTSDGWLKLGRID